LTDRARRPLSGVQALAFLPEIARRVDVAVVLGTARLAAPAPIRPRQALPHRMTRAAAPGAAPDGR